MAQSAGLADLAMDQRDPWKTSTYGVGEMLKEASLLKVNAILLGIGEVRPMILGWVPCRPRSNFLGS